MRYPNTKPPTEVLQELREELQKHLTTAPIYLDGLPPEEGVTNYYTLTHTAGTVGQVQRGIIAIIFWGVGIDPYPQEELELTRATGSLPEEGGIVWTPRDTPTTSYDYKNNYTSISTRVEYQFLTE